jgi:tetratricopeptide (TPR) repeat protein
MIQNQIQMARDAANNGNLQQARQILASLIQKYPLNENAWLLFAQYINDLEKQKYCLERVLKINPSNIEAQTMLQELIKSKEIFKDFPSPQLKTPDEEHINRTPPFIQERALKKASENVPSRPFTELPENIVKDFSTPTKKPPAPIPWYFSWEAKVFSFIFLLPAWCLIVINDPNEKNWVKITARFIITLLICGLLFFITKWFILPLFMRSPMI